AREGPICSRRQAGGGDFFRWYSPSNTGLASSTPSPLRSSRVAVSPLTFHLKLTSSPFGGLAGDFPFSSTSVTLAVTRPSLSTVYLAVTITPLSPPNTAILSVSLPENSSFRSSPLASLSQVPDSAGASFLSSARDANAISRDRAQAPVSGRNIG